MARRRLKEKIPSRALWALTFADMMTLLMTFFVLLVSMSHLDERRKQDYLTSTSAGQGIGVGSFNPLTINPGKNPNIRPGPMELSKADEMEPLREFVWENKDEDINLESNRFISIISINSDVLFESGSTVMSTKGLELLNKLVPMLKELNYPMLIAGHAATRRDETGDSYKPLENTSLSPSWKMSLLRSIAIYKYFRSKNVPPLKLMDEGFGEYRPKASNDSPGGRKKNRRVDLVLDRRNPNVTASKAKRASSAVESNPNSYEYKNFIFDLNIVPRSNNGTKPALPQEQKK